ncbi:MAG: sugar transferase [Sporichthyaceae bacterium]|jgi:lipopolysaccharide/colanic/teichoic acid biosynthesis glycosyltransferase
MMRRPEGRRVVDATVASVLLVLAAPVMLVVAAAIALSMGRPVIFRQQRVGIDGREFSIVKFRTMRPPAYLGQPDYERKTRTGSILRLFSLDELPQFVNIARGDMGFIGPRPALPEHIPHYTDRQLGRLAIRPGLTGWAQVRGRNTFTLPQRIEHDLWYIENRSWHLDLRIVGATVLCVLMPRNVVGEGGVNPTFEALAEQERLAAAEGRIPAQDRGRQQAHQ